MQLRFVSVDGPRESYFVDEPRKYRVLEYEGVQFGKQIQCFGRTYSLTLGDRNFGKYYETIKASYTRRQ
jgi:hypothetical protein